MFGNTFVRRKLLKLIGAGTVASALPLKFISPLYAKPAAKEIDNAESIPGKNTMLSRIEEICSWGVRRPGYPAGRKSEDYCEQQFKVLGLHKVHREPVPLPMWEPQQYSLTIITKGGEFDIDCFPLPHSALNVDIELPLTLLNGESENAMKGKAALVPLSLVQGPAAMLTEGHPNLAEFQKSVTVPINPEGTLVDPSGTLVNETQTMPFTSLMTEVIEPTQAAGASAFIGILKGHPADICEYYVPYDAKDRPFPAVWIKESAGDKVTQLLKETDVSIKLRVKAKREMVETYNIIGDLPGADEEIVLIGSHHDAPWASAVEDASGMALVMAQAEYWAKIPQEKRPHRLRFILQSGHMAAGMGGRAYLGAHQREINSIVLEVHLEHAASEIKAGENGIEVLDKPVPRWFFTSRNSALEQSVIDALYAENIDRAMVVAPDVIGPLPTTDGGMYHAAGVPLVNYLTAPVYLFDPTDTVDKIHQPSLEPITRATIRIINSTAGVSAAKMRAGIRKK